MKRPIDSELIDIPKGYPFWYEPMMTNLYTLEKLAKAGDGGGWGGNPTDPNIQAEINKLKEQHELDVNKINTSLNKIDKTLYGLGGLESEVRRVDKIVSLHTGQLKEHSSVMEGFTVDVSKVNQSLINLTKKHTQDFNQLERRITTLENNIGSGGEGGDLSEIEKQIDKINESIFNLQENLTVYEAQLDETTGVATSTKLLVVELEKEVANLSKQIEKTQTTIVEHSAKIVELGNAILINAQSMDRLESIVLELQGNVHNSHHVVTTEQEMELITHKQSGSICFVRSVSKLFIWDGKWSSISPEHGLNKILWEDILDAPESTPTEVDSAVNLKHIHGNKDALDTVSFSSINRWDTKAGKEDIPTKLSELENDIGAGGNYDEAIEKIVTNIGDIKTLTTDKKDNLVSAINEINEKIKSVTELERLVLELTEKVAYLEK